MWFLKQNYSPSLIVPPPLTFLPMSLVLHWLMEQRCEREEQYQIQKWGWWSRGWEKQVCNSQTTRTLREFAHFHWVLPSCCPKNHWLDSECCHWSPATHAARSVILARLVHVAPAGRRSRLLNSLFIHFGREGMGATAQRSTDLQFQKLLTQHFVSSLSILYCNWCKNICV